MFFTDGGLSNIIKWPQTQAFFTLEYYSILHSIATITPYLYIRQKIWNCVTLKEKTTKLGFTELSDCFTQSYNH